MAESSAVEEGLLGLNSEVEDSALECGDVLKRGPDSRNDAPGELIGSGSDVKGIGVSPARGWAGGGSPILRFALGSPSAMFQSSEYINKLLSDDPLLRSPALDVPNLLVDADGELVMPPPTANDLIETQTLLPSGTTGAPDANTSLSLLNVAGGQHEEFVLPGTTVSPGPISPVRQGGAFKFEGFKPTFLQPGKQEKTAAQRPIKMEAHQEGKQAMKRGQRAAHQQHLVASAAPSLLSGLGIPAGRARKVSLSAQAVKGGTQRKRAAIAGGSTPAKVATDPPAAAGKKRKIKGLFSKKVPGAAGAAGSSARAAGVVVGGPAGEEVEYSEEELKRIRRVKNRASVEKCRTKQRLRMEALEQELQTLQRENQSMLAVTKCVVNTFDAIRREVRAITGGKVALKF